MYYEEKIVCGKLMCRYTPGGDWEQCSAAKCGALIAKQDAAITRLRGQLQNAANHLQRAARLYDKNGSYNKALEAANKALYETASA